MKGKKPSTDIVTPLSPQVFKYEFVENTTTTKNWGRTLVGKQAMPFFSLTAYKHPIALACVIGNYAGNGYQGLALVVTDDSGINLHYFNFAYLTDYAPQRNSPSSPSGFHLRTLKHPLAVTLQVIVPSIQYELLGAQAAFHKYALLASGQSLISPLSLFS